MAFEEAYNDLIQEAWPEIKIFCIDVRTYCMGRGCNKPQLMSILERVYSTHSLNTFVIISIDTAIELLNKGI